MLKPKLLLPALLIAAAVPLVGATPASAGSFTQCGDGQVNGSGWYDLRAKNVSCKPARALADHYVFEAGGNDDGFKGWSCVEEQRGDELWSVKCGRGKAGVTQRAKFKYGA
jgi:hypothetical protein